MDRRYQVFVSSTYEDLQEERREVMQALLTLDCMPTGMELFPAADDDSWSLIQRFIEGCDYYIVIVGGRYGSKGPGGKSYTEMEYDYAVEARLPVLAFLHGDPGSIQVNKAEGTDDGRAALKAFREKIEAARHAKYWTSAKELAGTVGLSLGALMRTKPRIGWVRANLVPDEGTSQEILRLRREIEALQAKIAEMDVSAPLGTEDLSQGDEEAIVHYRYENDRGYYEGSEALSWNALLSILGPILIGGASEEELKDKLEEALTNRYRDRHNAVIYRVNARDEDFQRVKIQLRALGLIREAKGQERSAQRAGKRWDLTPHGDRVMTQVAAVRSSAKA